MSHAVENMAYAGQTPWHGLGFKVSNDLTPKQMLKAAKLDWSVSLQPLSYKNAAGKTIAIPNKKALVRSSDDAMLSVVGAGWKPVQNEEAMDFFSKFVSAGHMTMETAGSLWGGRYVWGLAKVGANFTLGKGAKADKVEGYLLLSSPHVHGRSMVIQFTPIRVVCWNTLNFALGDKLRGNASAFRLIHTRDFDAKVREEAEVALGLASGQMKQFGEAMTILSKARAKTEEVDDFFKTLLRFKPEEKKVKADGSVREPKMLSMFKHALEHAPGQQVPAAMGTWWGALNAVTYVVDHEVGRSRDTALKGAWMGSHADLKLRAFNLALKNAA